MISHDVTIPDALRSSLERFADRRVLSDASGSLTYRELDALANGVAAALVARGCRLRDRVVVRCGNTRWGWIACLAIWKVGAVVAAIGDAPPYELGELVRRLSPTVIIVDVDQLPRMKAALEHWPSRPTSLPIITDRPGTGDVESMEGFEGSTEPPRAEIAPGDPATILFSSGTTGPSKGVVHTHRSLMFIALGLLRSGINASDVQYSVVPTSHIWSQGMVMLPGLLTGARSVLGTFAYQTLVGDLASEQATMLHAPAPMIAALAQSSSIRNHDLSSLRFILTGGAPANVTALRRVVEGLPHVTVRQGYGTTEFGLSNLDGQDAPPTPIGKIGRVAPGYEMRVISSEGHVLGPGVEGEIVVRSAGMMDGYFCDDESTRKSLVEGWYHTGDIGYLDSEGYLEITDRLKHIIIVNTENVASVEVEQAIAAYPGVLKCAVIGVPHPASGEAVKAFVVPTAGMHVDKVALVEFLRTRLAAFKIPKSIDVVDSIPETASGKVMKYVLKRLAASAEVDRRG
jgi:acyl-coenzyme A synthetase/AMP-(fatty) acid ligase